MTSSWRPAVLTRRVGVGLALVALALQLALSFGHVHARDFAGLPTMRPAVHPAFSERANTTPGTLSDDDDHCPICFSGFLLATSVASQPDRPLPPDLAEMDRRGPPAFDGIVEHRRASFRSRAPPSA